MKEDYFSDLRRRGVLVSGLIVFSFIETCLAILAILSGHSGASDQISSQVDQSPFSVYSSQLGIVGWIASALIILQGRFGRRSKIKSFFLQRGMEADVYDLMVGMRGRNSRLALLQTMETPRHRMELSEVTGIDWKEVDRELGVLERYGLVKIIAQSGSVKLFQSTEQGRLLTKLMRELNEKEVNLKSGQGAFLHE